MMNRATGGFDVEVKPQAPDAGAEDSSIHRMTLDKKFHGDLEGISKGQMLAAQGTREGSAGYVALEQVTATLHGRRGTFFLHHIGTMTRGAPQLTVTVIPDSGTGELTGLAGRMNIDIAGGVHSYQFDYTISTDP